MVRLTHDGVTDLRLRVTFMEDKSMARAAIVIGVNKTMSLPPLSGAATDASAFADWLFKQGFETKLFVDWLADDALKSVSFNEIFEEVTRIVEAKTYTQLVVYFAGHGFQSGGSEVWLLSEAPRNAREAIGLEPSILAARESGLASVVFVSDACRSIPATLADCRIDGGSIFPNRNMQRNTRPEIDRFFATLPSLVAVEAANANDSARRNGVYTKEFLAAYRDPTDTYVYKVHENGTTFEVVTNRALKKLLQIPVEDAAHVVAPSAGQVPDAIVESENVYVGRVLRQAQPSSVSPALSVAEAVGEIIASQPSFPITSDFAAPAISTETATISQSIGLEKAINDLVAAPLTDHFETKIGFTITGARIKDVRSPVLAIDHFDSQVVVLKEHPSPPSVGTVLIKFENGTGTIVPGLAGYLGHIQVTDGSVLNVNYLPSLNTIRWNSFGFVLDRLQRLRAVAAAATRLGVFRVSREDGGKLADIIRDLKGADPSLGLYAAYAYSSAGLIDEVTSVRDYMRGDLGVDLFDVLMLSSKPAVSAYYPVVPPCPLLRQGWALLEVTQTPLSPLMQKAREWLRPGLWTTFAPEGMDLLFQAADKGELQ